MKIVRGFPPNIDKILAKFRLDEFLPIFTYGDILYNPHGLEVSDDLMAHEEVHQRQQKLLRVEDWWAMYLENKQFRLNQEVEAYRAQYKCVCKNYPRKVRRALLQQMAHNLSSALYGRIISKAEAQQLIEE